jgi:hypothetical protein
MAKIKSFVWKVVGCLYDVFLFIMVYSLHFCYVINLAVLWVEHRETSPDLSNNYNHTLPVLNRLDRIYNANFSEIYIFVLNGLVVPCEIMCVKEQRKTKQQLYCRNSSKIQ